MKLPVSILLLTILLAGCDKKLSTGQENDNFLTFLTYDPVTRADFNFYSETVGDTFHIFASLPKGYDKMEDNYPVVYILDANVAFVMIATLMKVISNGLDCKQAIYIGIGYSDFFTMDSLRFRDYSFPTEVEGYGAGVFSDFLETELIPTINGKFRTKPGENILIGHSLSGYFAMHHLLLSAAEDSYLFKGYVAGSAFIGNDSLFLDEEDVVFEHTDSLPVKLFMCSGTVDDTDSMQVVFADVLKERNYKGLEYKSIVLDDFGHMDAMFPTWTKGLRYMLRYD